MNAKFVENTVIELINGKIVLSLSDLAMPPFSIDPKDWYAIKDAIDELVPIKRRPTREEEIEQIKADPELAERMISTGLEIPYAKDRMCYMWWTQKGYGLTLVDHEPYNKDEKRFDNVDDFKTEFLKLKPRNPNRDWEENFDSFMFGVNDIKKFYGIGGGDE
ncbi:hypothetical protein ACS8E2_12790 [Psychrobacter glaciei]|uniref:hypothetical protein n=1 Tax=Psychrobacter glaciei TaxID=619771 RepID=UPI003F4702AE